MLEPSSPGLRRAAAWSGGRPGCRATRLQSRQLLVHRSLLFGWWCVVLLKRHSSIVRRPGRTCKHVRSPNPLPAISDEVKGSHAIAHATAWGKTY